MAPYIAAAANALAGHVEEAKEIVARLYRNPGLRISTLREALRKISPIRSGPAKSRVAGVITAAQPRAGHRYARMMRKQPTGSHAACERSPTCLGLNLSLPRDHAASLELLGAGEQRQRDFGLLS
jgi:hypothetical protein